ncbi:threonine deaminase [Vanrija albida]|uniref:Threonine dehydratase n=1 Tax=Vanrija albida TaxID=181172 RepID=A0ABR3PXL7_9TREE
MSSNPVPVPTRNNLLASPNNDLAPLAKSPPNQTSTIEYASSAPFPPSSSKHAQDGTEDESVPDHLYAKLPKQYLEKGPNGQDVPDYLRMILTSKVYSAPLNLSETPLTYAANLSKRLGCEIWLKREDLQPVFSFKIRGAYNMMASLTEEEKKKGVITCSAGNHAQGVALSGKALGIEATVVMPLATPSIKVNNVRRLGGNAVLHGQDFDGAKAECLRRAKEEGLTFIPPYDDPYVVAGQGTIAMEICRQVADPNSLDGVFAAIGGGGLVAGIAAYLKRVTGPETQVFGVETVDGDAMDQSLKAGKRVLLDEVGPFADGTAVRLVGEEPFRVCKELIDGVVIVDNDEICAGIKDVFEETRSVPEPSGALALAGLKAHIMRNGLQGSGKKFIAVVSGGNMNFGRLRFVAERADIGERREVLMSFQVPERPGSFVKLHNYLNPRAVTEFSYRYSPGLRGHIICSFYLKASSSSASGPSPNERQKEVDAIISDLGGMGIEARDLTDNEFAKSHVRHLVGGRANVEHERVFRFAFPERPGALARFLTSLKPDWNISLFHYRNHGADVGKVLVGLQVPPGSESALEEFLEQLGYPWVEETDNIAYQYFMCPGAAASGAATPTA